MKTADRGSEELHHLNVCVILTTWMQTKLMQGEMIFCSMHFALFQFFVILLFLIVARIKIMLKELFCFWCILVTNFNLLM